MLHEFLHANRDELARRCAEKVSRRSAPRVTSKALVHGIPVFLDHLIAALRADHGSPAQQGRFSDSPAGMPATVRSQAGMHGKELFDEGYTVDQVVHDYGDLCQAATELAKEKGALITVDEYHTFNRMLDNAIADAVLSHAHHREQATGATGDEDLHAQLGKLAEEQRVLLDTALKALEALKYGDIGVTGATGTLLQDTLLKLRQLIERSLPEIRLASRMTAPPKH